MTTGLPHFPLTPLTPTPIISSQGHVAPMNIALVGIMTFLFSYGGYGTSGYFTGNLVAGLPTYEVVGAALGGALGGIAMELYSTRETASKVPNWNRVWYTAGGGAVGALVGGFLMSLIYPSDILTSFWAMIGALYGAGIMPKIF